jgi:hypothetical protein
VSSTSQNVGATPLLVACGSGGMLLATRFNGDEFSARFLCGAAFYEFSGARDPEVSGRLCWGQIAASRPGYGGCVHADENLLPPGLRGSFARYTSLGAPSVNAFAADDEEAPQDALIKLLDAAKINLQQGLAAGEQEGQPISANFEVDEGKLQL